MVPRSIRERDEGVTETDIPLLLLGFGVSVMVVRTAEWVARRRSVFDHPKPRGLHAVPVPRLGGVGLLAGTVAAVAIGAWPIDERLTLALAGGAVLWLGGLLDDLRPLGIWPRFVLQVTTATLTAVVIAPELALDLPSGTLSVEGAGAQILCAAWIVAVVNAFNFMDGIDGMAAFLVLAAMPAAFVLVGQPASALAVAVGAACAGFLVWNFHPASIFMGDGGSMFLGYTVSVLLLSGTGPVPVVPAALILGPALADTGLTLLSRLLARKNILTAHDTHLFQRLVRAGVEQRAVTAAYAVATVASGWLALGYRDGTSDVRITILTVVGACLLAAVFLTRTISRRNSAVVTASTPRIR